VTKVSIIVAADPNGVIGVDGAMPWHYKADFKRFKERTMAGVLVMGRKTFESLPLPKAGPVLPGRDIIILSRSRVHVDIDPKDKSRRMGFNTMPGDAALIAETLQDALSGVEAPVWIAGGGEVYRAALKLGVVTEIDFTLVPEVPPEKLTGNVVRFPKDLLSGFELVEETVNAEDDRLRHLIYRR
jgi:dihydrofolate reductase